jgi:hypothetical protein
VALKVSVVPLRLNLFSSAPPVIRKSASPLLVVRLITLYDVDSDNSKLSYRIGGADKEHFVFSASKQLIMKNKVDIAMARLGSTVMVNLLEVLLPAGSVT